MSMTTLKYAIYYGSWLLFPLIGLAIWRWRRSKGIDRIVYGVMGIILLLGIWARFVEPQWLRIEHVDIRVGLAKPLRLALISDVHLGLYKQPAFLERVVAAINAEQPDAVLVAGDLTYEAPEDFRTLFAAFRQLRAPGYYVPGNHDEGAPGPPIRDRLHEALVANGLHPLEGDIMMLGGLTVVGLGDLWVRRMDWRALDRITGSGPVALLMHNPDSLTSLPNDHPRVGQIKLALAGHTHCGQVRLPVVYRWAIPTLGPFDCGWHDVAGLPLFITPGLGEIGLPLRFLNPPTVSMVTVR